MKSFARSSAGLVLNIPKLVRPEAVLLQTLNYLWTEIIDIDAKGPDPRFRDSALYTAGDGETPSVPFIFGFISDRTRSIRKDFSLQGKALEVSFTYCLTCAWNGLSRYF